MNLLPPTIRDDNAARENPQATAIESLAADLHMPLDRVRRTFEEHVAHLKTWAKVQDFLIVIAVRKTREALQHADR